MIFSHLLRNKGTDGSLAFFLSVRQEGSGLGNMTHSEYLRGLDI